MDHPLQRITFSGERGEERSDGTFLDLLVDNRWLILGMTIFAVLIGLIYVLAATPIYRTAILVQVEETAGSSKNVLGEMSSVFNVKGEATAEMEIIRSRFVLSRAVENAKLDINVQPKYFPLFGAMVARHNDQLSNPGLFGLAGYVWGRERAEISVFNVPEALESKNFVLTAGANGEFRLALPKEGIDIAGRTGAPIKAHTSRGEIELKVDRMEAKPGAQFLLSRAWSVNTIEKLQRSLSIAEKGRQSGIISVSLEGADPKRTANALNAIANEYVRQNVDRKSEEAQKSLAFLEKQLPELKREMERAEAQYNEMRNRRGTVNLGEESRSVLQQSVLAQSRLMELKQKRGELLTRFLPDSPAVEAIDQQIRAVTAELTRINGKIKHLPAVEQDVFQLSRDLNVNKDLYISLLNSAQQLRLVKASKVGNVRLLDQAVEPRVPVKPDRGTVVIVMAMAGLILGVMAAFIRRNIFGGIDDPHKIEQILGLPVSAVVPHSHMQEKLYRKVRSKAKEKLVLAEAAPNANAIEGLRSLRTSLQFSLLDAKNNIVMLTGPTPGVGKSFISANLAAVLASMGKKVLLIDGDLRKGHLHRYFGLDREPGLSETAAGQLPVDQAIHRNVIENVDFIPAGATPPKPAELLARHSFGELLRFLARRYDVVLIDTAPVLAVSDVISMAAHAGLIFNVAHSGVSTIGEIEEAIKRLKRAGGLVAGIVLNDLRPHSGYHGYGSKYGRYRYVEYKYY